MVDGRKKQSMKEENNTIGVNRYVRDSNNSPNMKAALCLRHKLRHNND